MCTGSKPKAASVAPTVAPAAAPELSDASVKQAKNEQNRRAAAESGRKSTLLTSEGGVGYAAATTKKTLLGA